MYEINELQHGKHFVWDFLHLMVLYQISHSFVALTRSISDTCISPTCVKIPYGCAFHEVIFISGAMPLLILFFSICKWNFVRDSGNIVLLSPLTDPKASSSKRIHQCIDLHWEEAEGTANKGPKK